ncbi:TonB-dependent receptor plug domain-containing protein [Undibacterium sp. TJN19]|uniref:TonB-dependent receptor plug domain-containing protein n=1 Tax=Undibacterium sp. TJN19 TaxID=3413055 RepID=UPI003BF34A4E
MSMLVLKRKFSPVFLLFFTSAGFPDSLALAADAPAKAAEPLQTVEVAGPRANAQRRNETAAKIVITSDELQRFGDNELSSVLRRQPGISVVVNELRLRGLGAGYTQILVNGDAVAPGFSIDSISPDLIERVEILRTTTAEFSAQAIAGTINIILKKNVSRAKKEFKFSLAHDQHNWNPALGLEVADKTDGFSDALTANLSRTGYETDPLVNERVYDANGKLIADRLLHQRNIADFKRISATPRLNWSLENGDTISWQSFIDYYHNDNWGGDHETTLSGQSTQYPANNYLALSHTVMLRSDVNWAHRLNADAKLNLKLGLQYNKRNTDYVFNGFGLNVDSPFVRHVVSNAIDSSFTSSGKYLSRIFDEHSLALGWDAALIQRSEARVQYDRQPYASLIDELDEDYQAHVRRLALFAQDEWDMTSRLQAYLGLRWEGLNTETEGRLMTAVQTRSSVWSPVMQFLWKLPDSEKDQLRFALSRTYKAPTTRNLVPRRYTANNDNGPNNPDFQGNPHLLPELAWSLDVAYETYFSKESMVSLSVYAKRVQDVTVQNLYQQNGVWISSPYNDGTANVVGIEFDSKFALSSLFPHAPAVDVRMNAARNWSRLNSVPGPDNRLTDQVPLTANLGADYKMTDKQTVGFNMNFQNGGVVQVTPGLRTYSGVSRNVDLYALWKLEQKAQIRLTINNLLHQDNLQASLFSDATGKTRRLVTTPGNTTIRLVFEKNL